ncbi:putative DBH-like monooxygenase protein 2 [Ambystoma mexicanum]|uniref:putative DBH-like monooxygenase protein 2 n=1 Tax=Ambystoma mexicanum TaxID=8296 RepID=UPI0037E7602E
MEGADIVIGGVFPNQTTYFSDYHSVGKTLPAVDEKQDYKLISLAENGSSTVMRFSRPFRTCDPNDMDITTDTMRVIYAYGVDDAIEYHAGRRGTKSIQLLQEDQPARLPPPSTFNIKELIMDNFTVPATETTYACTFAALPAVTKKHHIYKFEPIIQAGNEALIHHIVLYSCPRMANVTTPTGQCQDRKYPHPFTQCFQNMVAWGVGGEGFQFPSHVGISLGTLEDPTHVMMEIHYSNFHATAGLRDSSGMRLYYTSEVRKYDVGILEVGPHLFRGVFIPPRVESFQTYGLCYTDHFPVLSPAVNEMHVFASLLHTHLAGRAVQIAQYRNGSQIGFLGRDMNYDFNLQETRLLQNEATLKVGDAMLLECTYNTMDRANITLGGMGTKDEMCMAFLYIYPRSNITNCNSVPDLVSIATALGRNVSSFGDAAEKIRTFQWDAESTQILEEMSRDAMQFIYLASQTGFHYAGAGHIPNITQPTSVPCNGMPDSNQPGQVMPDHHSPDHGLPGVHQPYMNCGTTQVSTAWFVPLLLMSFQATLLTEILGFNTLEVFFV